ncbi:MAG TPA: hypothetical protein PK358_06290 [Spirochaetota bacterium]|nr:hypothetical protein [Spirochaetota bacterium]HPJ34424.1 hypothetical protein [Spirochaetota bacterium]
MNSAVKKINSILLILLLMIIIAQNRARAEQVEQITFKNVPGTWTLMYENSYGYSFKLGKNYKAVVTLYLSTASLIFKGVYTIEDNNVLRINISEMKREEKVKGLNTWSGFKKAKASYFLFQSRIILDGRKRYMEVRPAKISIDGNDSGGYFEPLIKLVKTR